MIKKLQTGQTLAIEHRGYVKNSGVSTTRLMIYLALVSVSSLAFATVSMKNNSLSEAQYLADAQSSVQASDVMCLRPADSLSQTSYLNTSYEKFRPAVYTGSIQRVGNLQKNTSINKPDTLWNPLAKVWLNAEQVLLLKTAFDIGYQDGGLQHAKLIQGMLLQETIAGLLGRIGHMTAPVGKRSYGVMQVKVTAATDVLAKHAYLDNFDSESELIANLIIEDEFNIRIASKHFLHLRTRTKTDAHALLAYNIGLRASRRYSNHDSFRYVKKVKRYSRQVAEPFNEKFNSKVISKNQFAAKKISAS